MGFPHVHRTLAYPPLSCSCLSCVMRRALSSFCSISSIACSKKATVCRFELADIRTDVRTVSNTLSPSLAQPASGHPPGLRSLLGRAGLSISEQPASDLSPAVNASYTFVFVSLQRIICCQRWLVKACPSSQRWLFTGKPIVATHRKAAWSNTSQ